jgi:D-alanyl-D-alanine carboxypeptidase
LDIYLKNLHIVSTKTKSIPHGSEEYNRQLVNHNKFLNMYDGCIGVKTGFTKATGRCLVTAVEKNGMTLVCVTLNAPDDWNDHGSLLENGFSQYCVKQLVEENQCLGKREIAGGQAGEVELLSADDFFYALAPEEKPRIVISGNDFVYAPVVQGQEAGYAYVLLGDKIAGKILLKYGNTVEQENVPEKSFWQKLFGG